MQPRPRGPEPELGPGSLGLRCRRGASSASAAGRQGSPARTRRDPRRPPERARSPARWPKLSEPPGPAWLCAHILSRKLHPRRRFSKPPEVLEGRRLTLLLRGSIDLLTLIQLSWPYATATLSPLLCSTAPKALLTEDTRMARFALATLLVSTTLPFAAALAQTEAEPDVTPAAPVEVAAPVEDTPPLRPTVAPSEPPITALDPVVEAPARPPTASPAASSIAAAPTPVEVGSVPPPATAPVPPITPPAQSRAEAPPTMAIAPATPETKP